MADKPVQPRSDDELRSSVGRLLARYPRPEPEPEEPEPEDTPEPDVTLTPEGHPVRELGRVSAGALGPVGEPWFVEGARAGRGPTLSRCPCAQVVPCGKGRLAATCPWGLPAGSSVRPSTISRGCCASSWRW